MQVFSGGCGNPSGIKIPPRTCSASEASQDRDQPITHEGLQEPLTKSRNRQDGNLCGNRLGWYAFLEILTNNGPPRPLLWPIKRLLASMLSSRTSELAQFGHATAEGGSKHRSRSQRLKVPSWPHSILKTQPSVRMVAAKPRCDSLPVSHLLRF